MSNRIARRQVLLCLPALTLPFALSKSARAQAADAAQLQISAVDSLLHYRTLLESVRGDAYESAAKSTVKALQTCDDRLDKLRKAVTDLQKHLQSQAQWPQLRQRFATLEQSLELIQDKRTGQLNETALRALPATLEGLRALMKEISSECNADPDGEIQSLVDHIYSRIADQNSSLEEVDAQRGKWSHWLDQIENFHGACGDAMDDAAVAIADGVRGSADWRSRAEASLQKAIDALHGIEDINSQMAAQAPIDHYTHVDTSLPGAPTTALLALTSILDTTRQSLTPPDAALYRPASYSTGGGQPSSAAVPSFPLGQNDAGLISEVQYLVSQPRYFTPGSTTQTINCIAVCWPVWVVYGSNSDSDVRNRTSLIASALYFGLIRGVRHGIYGELSAKLQDIYVNRKEALGA